MMPVEDRVDFKTAPRVSGTPLAKLFKSTDLAEVVKKKVNALIDDGRFGIKERASLIGPIVVDNNHIFIK